MIEVDVPAMHLDHFRPFPPDDDSGIPLGDAAAPTALESAIFTGDLLRALADREPTPPVYPGIPPKGHFSVRVGPSFTGKTTAELGLAMSRAVGCELWEGSPKVEQGRTLIISPDEPVEQLARQILRLARTHPGGRTFDYFAHIEVIGLDSSIPMDALEALKFDDLGFALISDLIKSRSADAIVFDAYGDMLPEGVSEDSNADATRIGGRLEALAVQHNIPVSVIQHVGKTGGQSTSEIDVRDLGRGASALASKARCISTFEEIPDFPNHRRIRTRTNLTRSPAPLDLEVTARGSVGAGIDYMRHSF